MPLVIVVLKLKGKIVADTVPTIIAVTGVSVNTTVEWSRNELGTSVSLQELLEVAQREFSEIPLEDLIVTGSSDSDQYNAYGASSSITLRHKTGW